METVNVHHDSAEMCGVAAPFSESTAISSYDTDIDKRLLDRVVDPRARKLTFTLSSSVVAGADL
jgi:hypothetical protein